MVSTARARGIAARTGDTQRTRAGCFKDAIRTSNLHPIITRAGARTTPRASDRQRTVDRGNRLSRSNIYARIT